MFISKEEKKYLFDEIKGLSKDMSLASSEITYLKAKIRMLEARPIPAVKKKYPKKPLTDAQRAKQAEYMKAYHAKKRAEKALEQA
jgi:regulator of replication initiation timing